METCLFPYECSFPFVGTDLWAVRSAQITLSMLHRRAVETPAPTCGAENIMQSPERINNNYGTVSKAVWNTQRP